MSFYYDPSTPGTPFAQMSEISGMRLSLSSTLPVADSSGVSTIYLQPYLSDCIWVPTAGGLWKLWRTSAVSLDISALTNAGVPRDLFLWDNAGTLTLKAGTVWTNETTRANALTTLNGVLVNGSTEGSMAASTGVFLGSFTTTGGGTTEDSLTTRYLVNNYNAIRRPLYRNPGYSDGNSATTYTTTSTNFTAANGAVNFQLSFMMGRGQAPRIDAYCVCASSTTVGVGIALSFDSSGTANVKAQSVGTSRSSVKIQWSDIGTVEGLHQVGLYIFVVSGTGTYWADDIRSGGTADVPATYLLGHTFG